MSDSHPATFELIPLPEGARFSVPNTPPPPGPILTPNIAAGYMGGAIAFANEYDAAFLTMLDVDHGDHRDVWFRTHPAYPTKGAGADTDTTHRLLLGVLVAFGFIPKRDAGSPVYDLPPDELRRRIADALR